MTMSIEGLRAEAEDLLPAAPRVSSLKISVAICTRNRPEHIGRAVASVLCNDYPDFELVVIDQSSSDDTCRVLSEQIQTNPCLRYVHTDRVGVSPARNTAVAAATGEVIAFTDDDCVVPTDWLTKIERAFAQAPDADLLYGQALIPDELKDAVPIPALALTAPRRISRKDGFLLWGMTANCAARSQLFSKVGGFDELLGPGRRLRSGEDFDLHYRVYRSGLVIGLVPEIVVDHYGVRSLNEWRQRLIDYGFGDAAFLMKHVRCMDARMIWFALCRVTFQVARGVLGRDGARPYLFGFGQGVVESFRFRIDRKRRLYVS